MIFAHWQALVIPVRPVRDDGIASTAYDWIRGDAFVGGEALRALTSWVRHVWMHRRDRGRLWCSFYGMRGWI